MTLNELLMRLESADDVCRDQEVQAFVQESETEWRIFRIRSVQNSTKVRLSDGHKTGRTFLFLEEIDYDNDS
jgi:hypothetical protein